MPGSIKLSRSTISLLNGRFDLISTRHPSSAIRAKTRRISCLLSSAPRSSAALDQRRGGTARRRRFDHFAVCIDQPEAAEPSADPAHAPLVGGRHRVERPTGQETIVQATVFEFGPPLPLACGGAADWILYPSGEAQIS